MYDHFYNKEGMMYYCGSSGMGSGITSKLAKMFNTIIAGYSKVNELK